MPFSVTMGRGTLADQLNGWYIYCDGDLSPREFLKEIGLALRLKSIATTSKAAIKRLIISKLQGGGRPLFLDEAHTLPSACFGIIRSIHDQTGCPIILAGTHEIFDAIDDAALGRGQMSSRCLRYNALDTIYNAEESGSPTSPNSRKLGRPLYTIEEIKALAESWQVRFADGGLEMAWALACLPDRGTLRTVRRVIELTRALHPGEAVTREYILEAMPLLFGLIGEQITRLADRHLHGIHIQAREAA